MRLRDELLTWLPAVWMGLLPWAGLLPGVNSWFGAEIVLAYGALVGWALRARYGTRVWLPRPLIALVAWALMRSLWIAWETRAHQDPITELLTEPMLWVVVTVLACAWMMTWTHPETDHVLNALRWSMALLVVYGVLQRLNLDQFQSLREWQIDVAALQRPPVLHPEARDIVGGTVGNASIFACWLAMCLPLWMTWTWRYRAVVVVTALGLIFMSGSLVAVVGALLALWWMAYRLRTRRWWWIASIVLYAGFLASAWILLQRNGAYFNSSGRLQAWPAFLAFWREAAPITGAGLGSVWAVAYTWPPEHVLYQWRHVHNEYLQVLVELGVIGAMLFVPVLVDLWWRWQQLPYEAKTLYGGILGVAGVAAVGQFIWHLAVTGALTLFVYSRVYAETQEG